MSTFVFLYICDTFDYIELIEKYKVLELQKFQNPTFPPFIPSFQFWRETILK